MQIDQPMRGFSFQKEGPLDMRMDPSSEPSAQEVVNQLSEKELGHIFQNLGEEPKWRLFAKAIVAARKKQKITNTKQLADIILEAVKGVRKKRHPATLCFQALRLYVNRELESVEEGIKKAISLLNPGGKIGVISFHSLEDRIVKNLFREASLPLRDSRGLKIQEPNLKVLTKKPCVPTREEIRRNPRSRSAKLRFAIKL